jgi:hypothetical protein
MRARFGLAARRFGQNCTGFGTAIAATAAVIHAERERITIAGVAKSLALLIAVGVLAAGCGRTMGSDSAPVACTGGSPGTRVSSLKAALAHAPAPVRLQDGTSISDCLAHDAGSGDIQEVGSMLLTVTQNLVDGGANLVQLGYLSGAVHRGAAKAQGVDGEIERRIDQELSAVNQADPAFQRGERAGRANG